MNVLNESILIGKSDYFMKKHIILFLISIISFKAFCKCSEVAVSDNTLLENQTYTIQGTADFFWDTFINTNDISSVPDLQVNFPSIWNKYSLPEDANFIARKGKGSGTYRLIISNLKPETSYSFLGNGLAYTALKIYANGNLIYQSGIPRLDWENTIADQKMDITSFTTDKEGKVLLIFHVSNTFYRKGGVKSALKIQETSTYKNKFYKNLSNYSILFGILIVIFLYSLLISILKKDKTNLYLSIFVLSIFLRIIMNIFPLIKYSFPEFPYTLQLRLEYVALIIAPAFFTLYINSMNPDIYKHIKAYIIAVPGFILFAIDFVTPIEITNRFIPVMQAYMFCVIILNFILILTNSIRHKSFISTSAILTLIIIAAGAVSDIFLKGKVKFLNEASLLPYSFVLYAIIQTILLAYMQNRALIKVQKLNDELKETNSAYYRFVPKEFLNLFSKKDITEVSLGEYKNSKMAILSADIRNFTSLSEKMSEIQVFDMLNSYLKKVAPIIRKYNGVIEKYLGDGIIAIFPDSAESAIKCSIEMQEEMFDLRREFRQRNLPEIKIGVGVHYGNVIIGTGGDKERMTEISLSNDIDIAVKAEAATKIYQKPIIVTKEALSYAAYEARKDSRTFNFYGKKIYHSPESELYSIYSEKTGTVL